MSERWRPHLTVAAIVEQGGKFLLVEEVPQGRSVFNQPAGHVEEGEAILAAIVREVAEECCRHFTPEALVGLYRWRSPHNGVTYLRAAFCGSLSEPDPQLVRDSDIIGDSWFSRDELDRQPLRSPLVLRCIDDYLAGRRLPLDLITELTP
ncbi:MAG: NUDIX hydrolase [Chromatiales bacterium]|nr:NUDIX hydrolase [Chromatiales bacterium]